MQSEPDESALVAALRRGEAAAFDALYARYRLRIYSFLLRLSGRRDVADDLFQETFLQLSRHARTLTEDTNLAAFLFTIARNRYRSYRRRQLFRLDRLGELWRRSTGSGSSDGPRLQPTPHEELAASETAQRLEQALGRLSPPLREALLLVAVDGMEAEPAARVLGIEPAALRQRLSRARAQLQTELARKGPSEEGERHGT